jgi:hypothetical protein
LGKSTRSLNTPNNDSRRPPFFDEVLRLAQGPHSSSESDCRRALP